MKAVVTGGTGFIGRRLCVRLLRAGVGVTVLSRDAYEARRRLTPAVSVGMGASSGGGINAIDWDSPDLWRSAVAEADVVFHLAGASVAEERWTPEYKAKILDSRVKTTQEIADARPRVLICSSAVGYYGDTGNQSVTESHPPGKDYLAEVCIAWEEAAERASAVGTRVCRMRMGTVLGPDGGALQAYLDPPSVPFSPWKLGLGGPLGSGKQWVPWVHVDDVVGMMLYCGFEQPEARGPVNVVSPEPVTNAQFTHALGRVIHRPSVIPVPGFALKALVGEFAYALLYSQRVLPEAAQKLGYAFRFTDLDTALKDIIGED